MIKSVSLCNFRKHTAAKFDFTQGLQVMRGTNEVGKTTILESISYALWGTTALRTSLEDAVTYGQPQTTLKVVLALELDGVDYTITRGKSGAEIIYADQSVTGQKETRLFMERLFRCSADIASKLLFADQNAIRGILSEGPTAASGLVETLSELGLIESLIDKVQDQLPSGNTGAIDSQIRMLHEDSAEVPEEPSRSLLDAVEREFSAFSEKIDLAEQAVPCDQEVAKGVGAVAAFNAAQARISKIMPFLEETVTVPNYTEAKLAELRNSQANSAEQARKRKAYATVFPTSDVSWDGTKESFYDELSECQPNIDKLKDAAAKLETAIATAKVLKINEKSCAFCKKDLGDVPEVANINSLADSQIAQLTEKLTGVQVEIEDARENLKGMNALEKISASIRKLAGDYWDLSDAIPPIPSWIGAVPEAEVPLVNISAIEKALQVYQAKVAKRELLEMELAELEAITFKDISAELELIERQKCALADLATIKSQEASASRLAREALIRYDAAMAAHNMSLQRIKQQAVQLATLKKTQADMVRHNELVKKLRVIRPQVAMQLWATVLGATSHYFSAIRGQASVVTRDAAGFKVDGKGVAGLSGSTLDALGLAIRMSLSKLFLPGIPCLFLDGSFSGCDDDRELAGIGTLASAGFGQVILVTHSDAPESLADNLIVL